jgi:hypothetical protein
MSSSSPSDLAIAFRSLPRRIREAQGDTPDPVTAGQVAVMRQLIAEAARLMRVPDDAGAVADAIGAVPADEWDPAVLNRLREIALEAGSTVRQIEALADEG